MDFPLNNPTATIAELAADLDMDAADVLLLTGQSGGFVAPDRICTALGVPSGSNYTVARRAARERLDRGE